MITDTHITHTHTHTHTHTDRLVSVLEQYKDRLHQAGDNVHEEELDYIQDILASPIFNQYLTGTPPSQEDSTIIAEATRDLVTGIEDHKETSPADKRKSHLQRKQSLKALRNVVTPKTSKKPHRIESSKVSSGQGPQATSPSHNRNLRTEESNGLEPKHTSEVILPRQANGGPGDRHTLPITVVESRLNSRIKSLSNSTSTLIDRSTTNGGPVLRKKSSEGLLSPSGGSSLSGSQPNISALKPTPQMTLNGGLMIGGSRPDPIGAPLVGLDLHLSRPSDHFSQTSSSSLTPDSSHGQKLVLSPETRPPPPSYHAHMQKQSTRLPVPQTTEQYTTSDHPQQLLPYRKAKSFDKLFDASVPSAEFSQSPNLHTPHQPPALTPPTHPMTNGLVTKDVPTAERRKTTFTVRMDKGAEGLGFMVKAVKSENKGEVGLSIQDLQPGGPAER